MESTSGMALSNTYKSGLSNNKDQPYNEPKAPDELIQEELEREYDRQREEAGLSDDDIVMTDADPGDSSDQDMFVRDVSRFSLVF